MADTQSETWYDIGDPAKLHRDMALDFVRVRTAMTRRPALSKAHADCVVCAQLAAEQAARPAPAPARRRGKIVITQERMRQLLRLPESVEIVHMWAHPDPNSVSVLVEGPGLPAVPPGDVETDTVTAQSITADPDTLAA